MRRLLVLALASCATPTLLTQAPPPPAPTVSPLVSGEQATVALSAPALAGVSVAFVRGVAGAGPCPPALRGACLAVTSPVLLGRATGDPTGRAQLRVPVQAAAGEVLTFQAVMLGARPRTTGTTTATVLDPALDPDLDGLNSLDELAAGTHPTLRDTDGGGVRDGQEVQVDHTDPLASGDDRRRETACANQIDDDNDGRTDCQDVDCGPICGETCDDYRDNDLDHLFDCDDPDCLGALACREVCTDHVDNDRNGLRDCADPVCVGTPSCVEDCHNHADDDQDSRVDCRDPDCAPCVEVCNNGLDDDLDWAPDCFDPDCGCVEQCGNGVDDDVNGLVDCEDPGCPCVEDCANTVDDDRDLRVDCQDVDCACVETCEDGVDADGDGLTACADPDCACGEVCGNGVDDDSDGLVDCEDGGCTDLCTEDCANGVDDNGDAWVDCQDDTCWSAPGCEPDAVLAWVRAGTLDAHLERSHYRWQYCGFNYSSDVHTGVATGVAGRVRVEHDGRVETCDWRVDRAGIASWHGFRQSLVPNPAGGSSCRTTRFDFSGVSRTGFRVEPGCGLPGSSFLPPALKVDLVYQAANRYHGSAVARTPSRQAWYQSNNTGNGQFTTFRFGGFYSGSIVRNDALATPLQAEVVWGTCATGTPVLTIDPLQPGGRSAECAP